jgi:hypothetical protein
MNAWAVLAAGLAAPPLMPVYAVSVTASDVVLHVPAGACGRGDFTVAVLKRQPEPMLLIAPKSGRACGPPGPGHVELSYRLADLGLGPAEGFVLANPLAAEPQP